MTTVFGVIVCEQRPLNSQTPRDDISSDDASNVSWRRCMHGAVKSEHRLEGMCVRLRCPKPLLTAYDLYAERELTAGYDPAFRLEKAATERPKGG